MCKILFLILSGITIIQCVCVLKKFKDIELLEGYNITSSILAVDSRYDGKTRIACVVQCFMLDNCLSFFYNSITNQCQLHTEVFNATTKATAQAGTNYFYQVGKEVPDGTALSTNVTSFHCPTEDGYMMLGSDEMCVKFHTDVKSWSDANADCKSYSPIGHLVVVDTEVKDNLVIDAAASFDSQFNTAVYIGLSTNGWVDRSPLVYTSRKSGSTNGCVSYWRYLGWLWKPIDCNLRKHYVCQIPF